MLVFCTPFLNGAGLIITLAGAWFTARSVILTEDDAIQIGLPRWSSESREKNLRLPMVRNLLAASRGARRGLLFIASGAMLQLVAVVIEAIARISA